MTIQELINTQSHKVRVNSSLMAFYIEAYSNAFGKQPNCVGCTFKNDFKKLVDFYKGKTNNIKQKQKEMEKTFKYKVNERNIATYINEQGRKVRSYTNQMSEEFAIAYLTIGTDEQIEERKKEFKLLPLPIRTPKVEFQDVIELVEENQTEIQEVEVIKPKRRKHKK